MDSIREELDIRRSSYHVKESVKRKLEEIRLRLSKYFPRQITQEKFLSWVAEKLENANIEGASIIESYLREFLEQNNLKLELMPVIIIKGEDLNIAQQLYTKLYNLGIMPLYLTSDRYIVLMLKAQKEEYSIPVAGPNSNK